MRILLANWSPRRVGGTETYLERIAPLLADAGHEIALAYEVDAPPDRPRLTLPDGVVSCSLTPADSHAGMRAVRAWAPDVIYAHGLVDPVIEAALLTVAPAVFFVHSYSGTCISGDKTHKLPLVRPCDRLFGPACLALFYPRRCGGLNPLTMTRDYVKQRRRLSLLTQYAAVLTASEHMRRELERHGAAGGRVFKCPYPLTGLDVALDAPSLRHARSSSTPWRLAFVGRMDRLKGGAYLLDALPLVQQRVQSPLHLTLGGDGPARGSWQRIAARVAQANPAVRIEFPGWLQPAGRTRLLETTDLLVMPSLWPEPFGAAGPEANRRGVPVVAYAVGGIPEWLTDGVNGCLAPGDPPTVAGLADAIVRCLTLLTADDRLRAGALARAQSVDDAHVTALLNVLGTAAATRRPIQTDVSR
ncbi:MAG: glycosyltransferase family 4 protein [Burkholderiales bacterium]